MRAVVGHSDEVDAKDAALEVIRICREQLEGETPKAGLLFMSVEYEHQVVLDALNEEWPGLPLIGGSSDGEVSSSGGFQMDSVVLTLISGDDIEAAIGLGTNLSKDIDSAVAEASKPLSGREAPALVLTTFAPSTNASEVVRQLNDRIDSPNCPVLGGLTGDHREFSRMVEVAGTQVLQDSLPVLYLFGEIAASWGVSSGWFPIGEAHQVTASEGHLVSEIAGRPAIEVYEKNYGYVPDGSLGEFPLAVFDDPDGDYALRAVLGTGREDGTVRFAGEVRPGSWVRMTQVLPEGILSGSTNSMQQAIERFPGPKPEIGLLFSCAARKWVLGTRAAEEIDVLQRAVGDDCDFPLAGLYVYGEIAPTAPGSEAILHNETCITVLLGRK